MAEHEPDTRRGTSEMTRRDALKLGAAVSALGIVGLPALARAESGPAAGARSGPGHVVEVHQPGMIGRNFPHAEAARQMVHKAVTTLAGEDDLGRAWSKFVSKDDRVGIKINCLGGRMASTMKEIVDPVIEGLRAAGVADGNILIFDQFGGNMRGARFDWQDKPGKLRVINHDVLGYDEAPTEVEGARGRLARTLLWTTAVINVPPLKDHDLAGVTCAMKNMVFGCVEKPQLMHRDIHVGLPHFYALEAIRGRVRLNIIDGTFCLYDGGPKHNPAATDRYERVFATTDPVAADAVALRVVGEHRAAHNMRSLAQVRRPATYLGLAQELGLGLADPARLRLEQIELPPFTPPA
jgi:uncharacterized protein (DUF362 family)